MIQKIVIQKILIQKIGIQKKATYSKKTRTLAADFSSNIKSSKLLKKIVILYYLLSCYLPK